MQLSFDLEECAKRWKKYGLPADMVDKSYMDVGCWSGGFVKTALQKGAKSAMGVDAVRASKMHDINFMQLDVLSDSFLQVPAADHVSCFGVIYHVHDPVGLFHRLRAKCKSKLYLESECFDLKGKPTFRLFEGNQRSTNWFNPNYPMLVKLLEMTGFTDVTRTSWEHGRRVSLTAKSDGEAQINLPRARKYMGGW
jgi:hypothetical protein